MNPRIETIAIGDEVLTGIISDTNSSFVADAFFRAGFRLARQTVVSDDEADIRDVLKEVSERSDFAICFGGLGPTSDDRTVDVASSFLGCRVIAHEPSRKRIEARVQKLGRPLTDSLLRQARVPENSDPLPNNVGAAPGFAVRFGKCRFYFLPGVPREMKAMFALALKEIEALAGEEREKIHARTWRCIGIPESVLQDTVKEFEATLPASAWLGFRTRYPENFLKLYVRGEVSVDSSPLDELLAPWCYGGGEDELPQVVLEALKARGWTVALVESCTGGRAVQQLTALPGASQVVWGGYTTYQRGAKATMLGVEVSPEAAVSAECTRRLAERVREVSGCDVGAAVTGYMGPGGGTSENPNGTTYLCVVGPTVWEKRLVQPLNDRGLNQNGAALYLLNGILQATKKP